MTLAERLERSHHRDSPWNRVKAIHAGFRDQQHLAGLNASSMIFCDDIWLKHDGLASTEWFLGYLTSPSIGRVLAADNLRHSRAKDHQ
jgi:hypothetical protein